MLEVSSRSAASAIRTPDITSACQNLCLFGGGGLFLCGMLRGGWSGLTLAALGGLLLHRGLSLRPRLAALEENRAEDEPPDIAGSVPVWPEELVDPPAPASEEEETIIDLLVCPSDRMSEQPAWAGELSPPEHEQARVWAYLYALERGGGSVPSYNPDQAVEDFCRAVDRIRDLREREDSFASSLK